MPIILATQEAEIRRIVFETNPKQIVHKTLSRKTHHKTGLVEWLKVKALSSSPSTEKKNVTPKNNCRSLLFTKININKIAVYLIQHSINIKKVTLSGVSSPILGNLK
jgi:hypothetical protein